MKCDLKKWKRLKSKIVFSDNIIIRRDLVLLPNEKRSKYVYFDAMKGSAVAVIAINNKKEILLKKEYRYPLKKSIYDIPGGGAKKGEDLKRAALRELKEETGYSAKNISYLGSFYSNPSRSNLIHHIYLARGLMKGIQKLDESEFIQFHFYPIREVLYKIKNNIIKDPTTIIGLYLFISKKHKDKKVL